MYVTVNPTLVAQILVLKLENDRAANSTYLKKQRLWFTPLLNGWSGSPFDLFGLGLPYDRELTNGQYVQAIDKATDPVDPGSISDVIAANIQVDYMAAQERAFRSRHSSYIRSKMHAAGRRYGHSRDSGVFDTVLDYTINVINRPK